MAALKMITISDTFRILGQSYSELLLQSTSDFAVITTANETYLYFYASPPSATSSGSSPSIFELALPPADVDASLSLSNATLVASPDISILGISQFVAATYLPLSATASNTTITVCFAAGVRAALSGYSHLQCRSRAINEAWCPTGVASQLESPLQ